MSDCHDVPSVVRGPIVAGCPDPAAATGRQAPRRRSRSGVCDEDAGLITIARQLVVDG
jgi:hypothetical protein